MGVCKLKSNFNFPGSLGACSNFPLCPPCPLSLLLLVGATRHAPRATRHAPRATRHAALVPLLAAGCWLLAVASCWDCWLLVITPLSERVCLNEAVDALLQHVARPQDTFQSLYFSVVVACEMPEERRQRLRSDALQPHVHQHRLDDLLRE